MTAKKIGRPSGYKPEFADQAAKLCALGATDPDLADFFGISARTIARWQSEFPAFCQALKSAKAEADDRVERSLYSRAVGFRHEAVKIFMPAGASAPVYAKYTEIVAPDTTACIFWLKNRRKDQWRDVHKHEHGRPGDFDNLGDEELERIARGGSGEGVAEQKADSPIVH